MPLELFPNSPLQREGFSATGRWPRKATPIRTRTIEAKWLETYRIHDGGQFLPEGLLRERCPGDSLELRQTSRRVCESRQTRADGKSGRRPNRQQALPGRLRSACGEEPQRSDFP